MTDGHLLLFFFKFFDGDKLYLRLKSFYVNIKKYTWLDEATSNSGYHYLVDYSVLD